MKRVCTHITFEFDSGKCWKFEANQFLREVADVITDTTVGVLKFSNPPKQEELEWLAAVLIVAAGRIKVETERDDA